MISATSLVKSFTGDNVLDGINFKISKKSKIGLIGRNGCGKSTLFKIIAK